jgi:hypothetical protein
MTATAHPRLLTRDALLACFIALAAATLSIAADAAYVP